MDCKQVINLISAYADGELDSTQRADAEKHIGQCAECGKALESINALKGAMRNDGLVFNAPGSLAKRVSSLLDKAIDPTGAKPGARVSRFLQPKWIALAASVLVVSGIVSSYLALRPSAQQRMEAQAVARYQQSIQSNHVVDFASSDPKAVRSWLTGKLSFTPLVPNQPMAGYTLAGARIEKLEEQSVAAVVYRSGSHIAEIFQWPETGEMSSSAGHAPGGLNVSSWGASGWGFVAVSDDSGPPTAGVSDIFTVDGCAPH